MAKNPTPASWAAALLQRLGIPQSPGAIRSLVGWERAEGGHWNNSARYNPLNTTQNAPGAGNTGTQGNIKVYQSWDQGLNATVKTLRNGNYGGILHALKAGDPNAVASAIGSSPWGTNGGLVSRVISGTHATTAQPFTTSSSSGTGTGGSGQPPGVSLPTPGAQPDPGQASDFTGLLSSLLAKPQPQPVAQSMGIQAPSFSAAPPLPQGFRGLLPTAPSAPAPSVDDALGLLKPSTPAGTPGQAAANVAAASSPLVADASSGAPSGPSKTTNGSGGSSGASAALGWAESKIGFRETGTNSGGLASYLNKQFGFQNAPWCAMFTSVAVTKGGAPASARTASVAEVRRQAQQGNGGYQRGFVSANRAQAGDLILFGNAHIGMVQRVANGRVYYVGGNQSNGVTQASVGVGGGDIVRPKYGARR